MAFGSRKTTRENIRDPRLHWWKFWGDLSIFTEFISGFEIYWHLSFLPFKNILTENFATITRRNRLKPAWEAGKLQRIQQSNRVSRFYSQNIRFYILPKCLPFLFTPHTNKYQYVRGFQNGAKKMSDRLNEWNSLPGIHKKAHKFTGYPPD